VNCLVNISSTSSVSTSGSRYDTPPAADDGGDELTIDDGDTCNSPLLNMTRHFRANSLLCCAETREFVCKILVERRT